MGKRERKTSDSKLTLDKEGTRSLKQAKKKSESIASRITVQELSSTISHELANIVNNLNFHVYKLVLNKKKRLSDDEIERVTLKIKEVIKRSIAAIEQLRQVSSRVEDKNKEFSFSSVIQEALDLNLATVDSDDAPTVSYKIKSSVPLEGIYPRYFGILFLVFKKLFSLHSKEQKLHLSIFDRENGDQVEIVIQHGLKVDWGNLDRHIRIDDFVQDVQIETFLIGKLLKSTVLSVDTNSDNIVIKIKKAHLVTTKKAA